MKQEFLHTVGETMSLPPEAMAQIPLLCLRGKRSISIENHMGILGYSKECVKIAFKRGAVTIFGSELSVARMTARTLELRGRIERVELE